MNSMHVFAAISALFFTATLATAKVTFEQSAIEIDAYDFVEVTLKVAGPTAKNPFRDAIVTGQFQRQESPPSNVEGFCDSPDGTVHRIRFMPTKPGPYSYGHLTSVHGHGDFKFRTSPWADFAMYQRWDEAGGHDFLLKHRQTQAKTGRPMPQVNEEYGYEDHYPGKWGVPRLPAQRRDCGRGSRCREIPGAVVQSLQRPVGDDRACLGTEMEVAESAGRRRLGGGAATGRMNRQSAWPTVMWHLLLH